MSHTKSKMGRLSKATPGGKHAIINQESFHEVKDIPYEKHEVTESERFLREKKEKMFRSKQLVTLILNIHKTGGAT